MFLLPTVSRRGGTSLMTNHCLPRLFLVFLGFVLQLGFAACGNTPCSPDGSCPGVLQCDFTTDVCRPTCSNDDGCPPDEVCGSTGVCQLSARSKPECVGEEDCPCFANGSCHFGFICSSGSCISGVGSVDQPCYANMTCNDELDCVVREEAHVCRPPDLGGPGQACFSVVSVSPHIRCRSADLECEEDICRGGEGASCAPPHTCQSGFECSAGFCKAIEPSDAGISDAGCERRSECELGQFCCAEVGSPYEEPSRCRKADGTLAQGGECFERPSHIYGQPCQDHAQCEAVAPLSPDPQGLSSCVVWPFGGPVCSAPCLPSALDPGCPNGWVCEPGFMPCFSNEDCGGLACVGAQTIVLRPGRCRCGFAESGESAACVDPVRGLQGSCVQPEANSDYYCRLNHHCAPRN